MVLKSYIYSIVLCAVCIVLFSIGCKKPVDDTPINKNVEVEFKIDKSLLNASITDHEYSLQFCPPSKWEALNKTQINSVKEKFEQALINEAYSLIPIYIFKDKESNAFLSVSEIRLKKDSSDIALYRKHIVSSFDSAHVNFAQFSKSGLAINQLIIQDNDKINFKIFFLDKKEQIIQFDFTIPREVYSGKIRQLESSIGSIQLI